ncbi:MAG TPA: hypothetical protein PLQ45_06985, partial [Anaerohalosphaeraceae bacterium]|nr:hypothetical protein [Anaerohalosphaeraceae bacterium]
MVLKRFCAKKQVKSSQRLFDTKGEREPRGLWFVGTDKGSPTRKEKAGHDKAGTNITQTSDSG